MRYHFFLNYRWFLRNLGKEAVRTNMHTTVHSEFWFCIPALWWLAKKRAPWKLEYAQCWPFLIVLSMLTLNDAEGALCVQMDITWTFEANTKWNNMKYVWSHFYQILVVLKYHRCLWSNIFDTDIFRCINTHIKGVYLAFFGIFMLLEMAVSKILFHRHLWYSNIPKFDRNDFKHNWYCCISCWLQMSA